MAEEIKKTSGRTLDHVAGVYDILSPLMLFGLEQRMSRPCLKYLDNEAVCHVLDIGCGTGTLTIEIARRLALRNGSRVIGLDAAPRMIEVARKKSQTLHNIRFDTGIAEELPYQDESQDFVVSTFFFHHINADLKKRTLDEVWRVLRKGTPCIIVDVDIPTTLFGKFCAWAGFWLFRQEEIRENIEGKLRSAINSSRFRSFEVLSRHQGYITVFKLIK